MIRLRYVLYGLLRRWGSAGLTIAVGAFSVAGLCLILWAQHAIPEAVKARMAETDMVVGPKSSGLDLALCCALQLTPAQGLVSLQTIEARLAEDDVRPFIRQYVPIALGDSYRGHRIVWTTPDIVQFYNARLRMGRVWQKPLEIVAGAQAARRLNLTIGKRFQSSHGLAENGDEHSAAYVVTGILEPTGGVLDHLLLADMGSIDEVHQAHDDSGHDHAETNAARRVNAVLVRFTSEIAQASVPVLIRESEVLGAASPRLELAKLMAIVRPLIEAATAVSMLAGAMSGIILTLSLVQGLNRRARDLMLLRFLGMSRRDLAFLVLLEALIVSHLAVLAGIVLTWTGQTILADRLASYGLSLSAGMPSSSLLYGAAIALSLCSAFVPLSRIVFAKDDKEFRA